MNKSRTKRSQPKGSKTKVAFVKPPRYVDLPLIFSGPDSNRLWDAIGVLGGVSTEPKDIHEAVYQLATSMQAFEQRLAVFFKKEVK